MKFSILSTLILCILSSLGCTNSPTQETRHCRKNRLASGNLEMLCKIQHGKKKVIAVHDDFPYRGNPCRGGLFLAEFVLEGNLPPSSVALGIQAGHHIPDAGELVTIIADGDQFNLVPATNLMFLSSYTGCANLTLEMGVPVPIDTFLKIVNAKEIEMRFGDQKFPINNDSHNGLCQLAELMDRKPLEIERVRNCQ